MKTLTGAMLLAVTNDEAEDLRYALERAIRNIDRDLGSLKSADRQQMRDDQQTFYGLIEALRRDPT